MKKDGKRGKETYRKRQKMRRERETESGCRREKRKVQGKMEGEGERQFATGAQERERRPAASGLRNGVEKRARVREGGRRRGSERGDNERGSYL